MVIFYRKMLVLLLSSGLFLGVVSGVWANAFEIRSDVSKPLMVDENTTQDMALKLSEFSDLKGVLPSERFERIFKSRLSWVVDPKTGKVISFIGNIASYGVEIRGVNADGYQSVMLLISRRAKCLTPSDILQYVPDLKINPDPGPYIVREDDPSKFEFHMAYAIHSQYGYISFRFVDDASMCLREVGISQNF